MRKDRCFNPDHESEAWEIHRGSVGPIKKVLRNYRKKSQVGQSSAHSAVGQEQKADFSSRG